VYAVEEEVSAASNRPNVVFLLADDLGYGDVEYNGGVALTPNINKMASSENSIRFNRFYSSAPVCSPTRGSLLTGRNHNRFCVWMANTAGRKCKVPGDFLCPTKYPLPASEVTVAEVLAEQGYRTAAFGKWHLGDLKPTSRGESSNPGQNGFQVWKVSERAVQTSTPNCGCFNTSLCNLGHYVKQGPPPCTNYHGQELFADTPPRPHPDMIRGDDSEFIAEEFSKFLDTATSEGAPFFAYIPFHSVHKRYVATPPYDAMYSSEMFDPDEVDYYASISALDGAVGKIRSLLRERGISNHTMLWFSSDNGPANRCPGSTGGLRGRKGSLFEGGIRVPGIVEWPGVIEQNRESNYPVTSSDFLPTVVDALGMHNSLPPNRELDGDSILPVLHRELHTRNGTVKWAFNLKGDFEGRYQAVIMDNQYKLIASYKRGLQRNHELYDLSEDPTESHDLASQNPLFSANLLGQLEEWLRSVKRSAEHEAHCLNKVTYHQNT
jgi:arylsulfatase A-like enzyme